MNRFFFSLTVLFLVLSTTFGNQVSAQSNDSKSNGTLEIITLSLPDSIVFKPTTGISIPAEELYVSFISGEESFAPEFFSVSGTVGLSFDGGFIYRNETALIVKNTSNLKPQKIKFVVSGQEMFYDVAKLEWE
jgi:Thiol:disulfide interchange protein